ncbi:MAG: hypothetical protein ACRD3Q_07660 [Terriglobales bacterium]
MFARFYRRPSAWKSLVAGTAGGLIATVVMTQFQNTWTKASRALARENGRQSDGTQDAEQSNREPKQDQSEDATMKAAGKLARAAGYELSRERKKKAGPFVHYGFGAAMGALYGLAREFEPRTVKSVHPALAGSGYGTAMFLGADEIAVPALGLSEGDGKAPVSLHLYGLLSHIVYGTTLEFARKTIREIL